MIYSIYPNSFHPNISLDIKLTLFSSDFTLRKIFTTAPDVTVSLTLVIRHARNKFGIISLILAGEKTWS